MLKNLEWLTLAPENFRQALRAVRDAVNKDEAGIADRLLALASHRLGNDQLAALAKCAAHFAARKSPSSPLDRLRLGIVGAGTLDLAAEAIVASALRHRVLVEPVLGHYGSWVQDALDEGSELKTAGLDMLLIAPDHRMLGLNRSVASEAEARALVDGSMAQLDAIIGGFRHAAPAGILLQTVVPPVEPLFGSFDAVEPGSVYNLVAALNLRIAALARDRHVVCVDVTRVAHWIGLEQWEDPGQWYSAKLPFALDALPLYADLIGRTLGALRGKSRKCLVLDLDNTLWGGVIGDDGLEGIRLGQGSGAGEAFLAVQRFALELRGRGVILAVCSKNEETAARLPFRDHPEMVLNEDHIAVFHANWTDKASNLRAIAKTLNIGLDALVFLDDNPAEREIVRRELPMVAVPELPEDPSLYTRALACAGYFETVSIVDEDRTRADTYRANAERQALASTSDMAGYLASLEMECDIRPFDAVGRGRIAQLINKSNQFNLTTTRYTESEVATMETDPEKLSLQIRLRDRFGDNGMISVIVFDKGGSAWRADTWLMSCRVLGRRVEEAALAYVADAAKRHGARWLEGRYIPSDKNRMVAEHYRKLGFDLVEGSAETGSLWRLELDTFTPPELPMSIKVSS